jgi:hypothetical protein
MLAGATWNEVSTAVTFSDEGGTEGVMGGAFGKCESGGEVI